MLTADVKGKIARDLAERLNGTTLNLTYELEEIGLPELEGDADFCYALDNEVERCVVCDWWCETSEMEPDDSDQPVCEDCRG